MYKLFLTLLVVALAAMTVLITWAFLARHQENYLLGSFMSAWHFAFGVIALVPIVWAFLTDHKQE